MGSPQLSICGRRTVTRLCTPREWVALPRPSLRRVALARSPRCPLQAGQHPGSCARARGHACTVQLSGPFPSLAQMPASATWLLPSEARALPSVRPVSAVAAGLKDPDLTACTKVWAWGVPERGVTGLVPPEASPPGLWTASSPRVPVGSFSLCVSLSWPPLLMTRDS